MIGDHSTRDDRAGGRDPRASGQTLALFTILLPGLLALMALGLDGAQIFLERRDAQGAADLAAIAGAKELPDKVPSETAAKDVGEANGYPRDDVIADADYGTATQIEVVVNSEVDTFFMPILNWFGVGEFDKVPVSARAVAQLEPQVAGGGSYALYSLAECGDKEDFSALNWSGESNTVNGSVHSNAGTYLGGNLNSLTGEVSVTCDGSNITDKWSWNQEGTNPALSPSSSQNVADCTDPLVPATACRRDMPLPPIPFFDHDTKLVDTAAISAICDVVITSDTDIDNQRNGNVCALDHKLTIRAGASTNTGVTFFAREISMGDEGITLNLPHEQGILFYAVTDLEGVGIDYSGNLGSFTGRWFSPRPSSKVQFQGNQNVVNGALVGYRVDYSGKFNVLNGDYGPAVASEATVAIIE